MSALCILFITAAQGPSQVPPQVDSLVKRRVQHQYVEQFPDKNIYFDESTENCEANGQYHYSSDSLIMSAENPAWSGRWETSLTDLIEGRSLSFPTTEVPHMRPPSEIKEERPLSPSWFPWVAGAVVAGVAGFFILRTSGPGIAATGPPPVLPSALPPAEPLRFPGYGAR